MESANNPNSENASHLFFLDHSSHDDGEHTRPSKAFKYFELDSVDDGHCRVNWPPHDVAKPTPPSQVLDAFLQSSCSYADHLVSNGIGNSELMPFLLRALQKEKSLENLTSACKSSSDSDIVETTDQDMLLSVCVIRKELDDLQRGGLVLLEAVQELTRRLNTELAFSKKTADVISNSTALPEGALVDPPMPLFLPKDTEEYWGHEKLDIDGGQELQERKFSTGEFAALGPAPNRKKSRTTSLLGGSAATKKSSFGHFSEELSFATRSTSLSPTERGRPPGDAEVKGIAGTHHMSDFSDDAHGDARTIERKVCRSLLSQSSCDNSSLLSDNDHFQPWVDDRDPVHLSPANDDIAKHPPSFQDTSDVEDGIYNQEESEYFCLCNGDEGSSETTGCSDDEDDSVEGDVSNELSDTTDFDLPQANSSDVASIRALLSVRSRLPRGTTSGNHRDREVPNVRKRQLAEESADSSSELGSNKRFLI